ncbi:TlpA family protein disulfide reductase [Hufsiella ginkgonis]|uniref:Redoxin family protein n=1 Tax=Hufsiella ginkgonis TaxID=2695274 RepID=A0A7K1XZI5_9SPHI|nr:TlpA disulfide reductase family protein [Hufsiella ginkgonis]MXV16218.1 redoxin family protein [Hufsiella ginkgonis]
MRSDIIQFDRTTSPVRLSSFKGKYILLHFWASWCKISREDVPFFKHLQQRFRDKNFEIISIALDTERSQWLQAIDEDGADWVQLSDLRYWSNQAAGEFGIRALPANVLMDTDGEVITRNLEPEQLDKILEQLTNEYYHQPSLMHA